MHKRNTFALVLTLTVTTLALLAAAPAAAEPARSLETITLADRLTFDTGGAHDGLRLTLAALDGSVYETLEEPASRLSVPLVDRQGEALPDGVYAYELHGTVEDGEVLVRSGFFSIRGGAFVSPDVVEENGGEQRHIRSPASVSAEQTIGDDLFVLGSLCVGFDCVPGSSFGADTVVLRENNLRILFHDTSSTGSFPSNDWALVANDSVNGGANRFSIEDRDSLRTPFTILGGAPDDALFVNRLGRIGLGTATPALEIHVVDGDTPTLRLDQDTSGNFDAQVWDVGGNEANFFIRDLTHASSLVVRVRPGAPGNSLLIDGDGDVGLGTATPTARLDVAGSIAVAGTVDGRDVAADGATLDAHVADFANPHQVTAAQTGADPAGTAAAAVAGHEAAFDHGNIPSALPVPIAEGGTGATDAATARANLGIVDTKAGNVPAAAFAGTPAATASVTFATPFPTGTDYALLLTAVTTDAKQLTTPNVLSKDEIGFTVTLGGPVKDLDEVGWLARPVP